MPAFSGLYDGVFGEAYVDIPKSNSMPPHQRGIIRSLMQRRGMHGHVTALGRNAPATIAQVDASRSNQPVQGTFNYAAWKADPTGNHTAKDVSITNCGTPYVIVSESIARVADATEVDMASTYDTTLRNGHPADLAGNGVTSPAVEGAVSDGS